MRRHPPPVPLKLLDLPWLDNITRPKRPVHVPVVLADAEVEKVLGEMAGVYWLAAGVLYGTGMRLLECLRLRVKDVDFARSEIVVRRGKVAKDRSTLFPEQLHTPMRAQLLEARRRHTHDLAAGFGRVCLPDALDRKYSNAAHEWGWRYV